MDRQTFGCLGSSLGCFLLVAAISYYGFTGNAEEIKNTSVRRGIYMGYIGETKHYNGKQGEWKEVKLFSRKDDGFIRAEEHAIDSDLRFDTIWLRDLTDGDSLESLASLDELEKAYEIISGASSENN